MHPSYTPFFPPFLWLPTDRRIRPRVHAASPLASRHAHSPPASCGRNRPHVAPSPRACSPRASPSPRCGEQPARAGDGGMRQPRLVPPRLGATWRRIIGRRATATERRSGGG
ncbi:unnamed protein product [Closterium sp. NIES-54]